MGLGIGAALLQEELHADATGYDQAQQEFERDL